MVTITVSEFWIGLLLAAALGAAIHDFIWTTLVSDERAERHFEKASTKQHLLWLGAGVLFVVAVIGWMY
jgi:hypothetical protein